MGTLAESDRLLVGNEKVARKNLTTAWPPTWRKCVLWRQPTATWR